MHCRAVLLAAPAFRIYPWMRNCLRACSVAISLALFVNTVAWAQIEGFTEPYRDIQVAAADYGLLKSVEVKEGDRATAGQVLAVIDDALLKGSLEIAKSLTEARGRIESAQADVDLQTAVVNKLLELRDRNHASRQELDRAETQLRIAKATLQSQIEEKNIRVLEYERTRIQLDQRRLRSPIDGIVVGILKDPGEFVSLNDPAIVRVVQLDPLLVVFSTPASQARKLSVGQSIDVRIEDADKPAAAIIEFVAPTSDPKSGTVRVRVRIPNPGERHPCGATCRLILPWETPSLDAPQTHARVITLENIKSGK